MKYYVTLKLYGDNNCWRSAYCETLKEVHNWLDQQPRHHDYHSIYEIVIGPRGGQKKVLLERVLGW